LATLLCLTAGGCVTSTEPILSDAKGILGDGGQLHLFDVEDGATATPAAIRSSGAAAAMPPAAARSRSAISPFTPMRAAT